MKTWTRTLNMDDAHDLLAHAEPGLALDVWASACHRALPGLSAARRRELVRLLRDDFLSWSPGGRLDDGLFLACYRTSPAMGQVDLLAHAWALSHPLTLVAAERLVGPALDRGTHDIPLARVEDLVAEFVGTTSKESRRKTRTVLLGAMEGVGILSTRGTGKHRSLEARRGTPHPIAYAYLIRYDLALRRLDGMRASEAIEGALPTRLTCCTAAHAEACLAWCVDHGALTTVGDEVRGA